MNVSSVGPNPNIALPPVTLQTVPRGQKVGHGEKGSTATSSADATSLETQETSSSKGVIRNLLDGHYKGVADVRLRINFYDQLNAVESEQFGQSVRDLTTTLGQSINTQVESFLSTASGSPASSGAPAEALRSLVGQFAGAISSSAGASGAGGIQLSFDLLVNDLTTLLTVPEPAGILVETSDEEIDVSGVTDEGDGTEGPVVESDSIQASGAETQAEPVLLPGAQELIDELTALFNAYLEDLDDLEANTTILPPLSEPNGNGIAYEKFLAQYQQLIGTVSATEQTQDEHEPFDTMA